MITNILTLSDKFGQVDINFSVNFSNQQAKEFVVCSFTACTNPSKNGHFVASTRPMINY